jgi:hypothetical protein
MAARDARLFHPEFSTDPFWWRAWRPAPERGRGDVPARADVALIGGGLASLNAALELARAGTDCVVLEATSFGTGASTRNGGGVSGGVNVGKGLGGLKQDISEETKRAMITDAAQALDHIEAVIRRENIDCDYVPSGRFSGAFTPAHYRSQIKQCEMLNACAKRGCAHAAARAPARGDGERLLFRRHGRRARGQAAPREILWRPVRRRRTCRREAGLRDAGDEGRARDRRLAGRDSARHRAGREGLRRHQRLYRRRDARTAAPRHSRSRAT